MSAGCGQTIIGDTEKSSGEDITFSIRPESLRLSHAAEGDAAAYLPCTVSHSMFLGEKIRYFVRDFSDKEWVVDAFDTGNEVYSGNSLMAIPHGKPHLVRDSA